jgi:glycosyltransferase involved in cell wall biosynthesis
MKILHLSPYCPVPPNFGGALRIYHLLKGISRNNEVTFVTFGRENERKLLTENFGSKVRAFHLVDPPWSWFHRRIAQLYAFCTPGSFFSLFSKSRDMQQKIDEILATEDFDIVQMEFPIMGNFDLKTDAIKILDEHNIEYDNLCRMWKYQQNSVRRVHYYKEYKKSFREEIEVCKNMHAIFVVSERDRKILDKNVPGVSKFLIPNGVDTFYFVPSTEEPEPFSMVFTGMMGYFPNYDGMLYFLDEIFPLILKRIPQAKIYIVGNSPPKRLQDRSSDNVIVTGYVDDVRPYVWRSGLYVVPLRMGGGTRLKVLEALSMKKPVITTSIGCEGINVTDGESVLVEDDPENFALRAVELLNDRALRSVLSSRGYELIRSVYDWEIITAQMDESYKVIAAAHRETINKISEVEKNVPGRHERQKHSLTVS